MANFCEQLSHFLFDNSVAYYELPNDATVGSTGDLTGN